MLAVYEAAEQAVQRARRGEGPTLIECVTYRNYGHFEGDAQKYKKDQERKEHLQEKDAIAHFESYLLAEHLYNETELAEMKASVEQAVEKAVEFSENSPYPDASELLTDVYVSY